MSCGMYQINMHSPTNLRVIARGDDSVYQPDEVSYQPPDTLFTDHWKHSHSEVPPNSQSHMSHPRTRHTHSQSRTQFDYNPPRTRYDYNPSSLPSSPLSMSGVFTTPPSSAHLTRPLSPYHYPTTHTSPLSSYSSLEGHAPLLGYREPLNTLTSSYPSLPPTTNRHTNPVPPSRSTQYCLPREYATTHHNSRPYLTSTRSNMRGDVPCDWRSESWSAPTTTHKHPAHSTTTNSAHPLNNYQTSYSHSSTNVSQKLDLPSPSMENHPDSSPPTSVMVSPRHISNSQRSSYSSSPSSYIDIVCHPHDLCIDLGDPVSLHCEARIVCSSERPTYQWYKDEEPLIGEVDQTFRLSRTCKEDLGYYFCLVSNMEGDFQRKSSTACIKLFHGSFTPTDACRPVILDQPDSTVIVALGDSLSLRLTVKAHPYPSFQWFKNGNELPPANRSELVIPYVTATDEGSYICTIKNDYGAILSESFNVYVTRRRDTLERSVSPTKPLSPKKQTRVHHSNITNEVLQFVSSQICRQIGSGENIEGVRLALGISQSESEAIRFSYSALSDRVMELIHLWMRAEPYCSVASLEDALQVYGFRVSIPTITVTSDPLSQSPPVILAHPESVQVNSGDTVEMTVQAQGTDLTYQWYKDRLPYPGLTQDAITLTDVQESSTGLYYCCVKNSLGSVNSHPARVDVIPMKLKLPPSLQGAGYYSGSSSHDPNLANVFSPPLSARSRTGTTAFPLDHFPFDHEVIKKERTPSVSERLENLRIDNGDHRPVILQHPVSQSLSVGEVLNLTVVCDGMGGKVRYSWYFNGLAIPSERQTEFTLYCFTEEDVGDYSCEVTSEYGAVVMSDKAVVSLKPENEDD